MIESLHMPITLGRESKVNSFNQTLICLYSLCFLILFQACDNQKLTLKPSGNSDLGVSAIIPIKGGNNDMMSQDMMLPDMMSQDMMPQDMMPQDMMLPNMLSQDMMLISPSADEDNDSVNNSEDNCIFDYNVRQDDMDEDGIGDICDNCPFLSNADQRDEDQNGVGDECTWSGEGIEVILTHSGLRLDNDVFIEITPPSIERFTAGICREETSSPRCWSDNIYDSVQIIRYTPTIDGSSLISVKVTQKMNPRDVIKVRVSCGNETWLETIQSRVDSSISMWDVMYIAWPRCVARNVNDHFELSCDSERESCSCAQCVSSICPPNFCSEQVSCNRFSGMCDADCGGQVCSRNETCDQVTLSCDSPLCQSCSTLSQTLCPEGYLCNEVSRRGYCRKSCEDDSDCNEGESCESERINTLGTAFICTSPSLSCE